MNSTLGLSGEPVWQTYGSVITFGLGVVMYTCLALAICVIIIGRNIIPSLFYSFLNCCCRRQVYNAKPTSDTTNFWNKREVPLVSIFFLFFLFYNIYCVGTCLAMAMGYVGRILDHDQYTSNVIIVAFHVLYYGSFFLFYVYSCFYLILLMNVASVWFTIIEFGSSTKKKIFQGIISTSIACLMTVALLCILVIDSCIYMRMTNKPVWTTVLLGVAVVNVSCHAVLTFLAISLILFSIIMIAKFGKNATNNDRMSKLKIYSLKLIIAIVMLFLANTFRLTSLVVLGLQNMGAPSFISSPLLGLLIPDFLDMSVCIIIYWPFRYFCFEIGNATWQKIVNPINFNALYKEVEEKGMVKNNQPTNAITQEPVQEVNTNSTLRQSVDTQNTICETVEETVETFVEQQQVGETLNL